ncbi:hypothetical protein MPTK1_5g04810 [Marchantia polymorpha subsp. ruderalis]|uniref:Uncharacterized protein n=2 Tax=Marchantia polymorpha TaxID=3197 RepID=A0AAF6BF04_MARPO|nr:hypothetical protein MARPO_0027s0146 [Marchantia polymorpha]BBN10588.1 hypothetical protein Mp_5g04810 [Marchantia polymorpha subsp. ruderalis]|eukprot:PTQ43047.1 hypothetical protein MARPO_0027s0146 [Marchantia polymorpha]
MPLAREAKIAFRRLALNRGLKFFNVVVIVAGALTIIMVITLQQPPTLCPGWLLIFLGILTMVGGLSGFGGTTLPCCYMTHLTSMGVSNLGTLIYALTLFGQRPKILEAFGPTKYAVESVDKFLITCSWLYLTLAVIQVLLIGGRCTLQRMTTEIFETLEQTLAARNAAMGALRRELGEQESRVDKTLTNKIEEKMASKYGEWMNK